MLWIPLCDNFDIQTMKILVYHPRLLGDIILGATAAEQLKKKYPKSQITYITGCKALVETNPFIDIALERKIPRRYEKMYFDWKKGRYDFSFFLLNWLPKENCLQDFMAQCGLPRKNCKVKLYLTEKDLSVAKNYIKKQKLSPYRRTIAIQKDFDRKWNSIEFEKLKIMLATNYNLVFIGDGMRLNFRKLNMREAAAVISLCDVFIGVVSGTMHAAVGVGTPTICTPNVYNAEWIMPEFYQNDFIKDDAKKHVSVYPKPESFCGDYKCISLSSTNIMVNAESHTPINCPAGLGVSCIYSIRAEDVLEKIEEFFGK